jgi:hypothetical protein
VLRDAVAAGAKVALLAETASTPSEDVLGSCLAHLGPDLAPSLRVYTAGLYREAEGGEGGEEGAEGAEGGGGLDFRAAAARVQQRAAEEFVQRMGQGGGAVPVGLHARLKNLGARGVSAEWLVAVATTLSVPAARCLCVASSGSLVAAAAQAGMAAVAVPRQGALSATYEAAAAKFEGYGPGYATWPRLRAVLDAKRR